MAPARPRRATRCPLAGAVVRPAPVVSTRPETPARRAESRSRHIVLRPDTADSPAAAPRPPPRTASPRANRLATSVIRVQHHLLTRQGVPHENHPAVDLTDAVPAVGDRTDLDRADQVAGLHITPNSGAGPNGRRRCRCSARPPDSAWPWPPRTWTRRAAPRAPGSAGSGSGCACAQRNPPTTRTVRRPRRQRPAFVRSAAVAVRYLALRALLLASCTPRSRHRNTISAERHDFASRPETVSRRAHPVTMPRSSPLSAPGRTTRPGERDPPQRGRAARGAAAAAGCRDQGAGADKPDQRLIGVPSDQVLRVGNVGDEHVAGRMATANGGRKYHRCLRVTPQAQKTGISPSRTSGGSPEVGRLQITDAERSRISDVDGSAMDGGVSTRDPDRVRDPRGCDWPHRDHQFAAQSAGGSARAAGPVHRDVPAEFLMPDRDPGVDQAGLEGRSCSRSGTTPGRGARPRLPAHRRSARRVRRPARSGNRECRCGCRIPAPSPARSPRRRAPPAPGTPADCAGRTAACRRPSRPAARSGWPGRVRARPRWWAPHHLPSW